MRGMNEGQQGAQNKTRRYKTYYWDHWKISEFCLYNSINAKFPKCINYVNLILR